MEVVVIALLGDLVVDHLLGHFLEVHVERGVDAVAVPIVRRDLVLAVQGAQDVVDKVRREEFVRRRVNRQLGRVRRRGLRGGDVVLVDHRLQHLGLTALRLKRIDDGVIGGGRLRQADQHRGLGQGQVVRVAVKVAAGGGLDPVRLAAVIDGVQVHLEDGRLAVGLVQLEREDGLLHLSLQCGRRVGPDEDLLHQLLADGATALTDPVMQVVIDGGAGDAADVDPAVLVEAMVLDCDGGVDHIGGDVAERNHDSPVPRLADVGQQNAVPVVDQHVLSKRIRGQPPDRRKVPHSLGRDGRHRYQRQCEDPQERDQEYPAHRHSAALAPGKQVVSAVAVPVPATVAPSHTFNSP